MLFCSVLFKHDLAPTPQPSLWSRPWQSYTTVLEDRYENKKIEIAAAAVPGGVRVTSCNNYIATPFARTHARRSHTISTPSSSSAVRAGSFRRYARGTRTTSERVLLTGPRTEFIRSPSARRLLPATHAASVMDDAQHTLEVHFC